MKEAQTSGVPGNSTLAGAGANRLSALDSVRGLAALSVLAWHAAIAWPGFREYDHGPNWAWGVMHTPLHALWSGPQAVELFFVISGVVLALPFIEGRPSVIGFIVRRVFRLYPAYLAALVIALALVPTHGIDVPGASDWFAAIGSPPPTVSDVLGQATMIGAQNPGAYNPVFWSLVVEMRISLVFPLLAWVVLRYPSWLTLPLAIVVSAMEAKLGVAADEVHTVRWLFLFVAGILLARNRRTLMAAWANLHPLARLAAFVGALTLYSWQYTTEISHPRRGLQDTVITGVGAVVLVLIALSERHIVTWLNRPIFQLAGRLSYSIYLLHALAIVALLRLTVEVLPPYVAEPLAIALVLPAAWLCHRYIEVPAIRAGRILSNELQKPWIRSVAPAR